MCLWMFRLPQYVEFQYGKTSEDKAPTQHNISYRVWNFSRRCFKKIRRRQNLFGDPKKPKRSKCILVYKYWATFDRSFRIMLGARGRCQTTRIQVFSACWQEFGRFRGYTLSQVRRSRTTENEGTRNWFATHAQSSLGQAVKINCAFGAAGRWEEKRARTREKHENPKIREGGVEGPFRNLICQKNFKLLKLI